MAITLTPVRCSVLLGVLLAPTLGCAAASASRATPSRAPATEAPPPHLALSELLAPSGPLAPSPKANALNGKRVRLTGFMADMEIEPLGAVYLVPRPLRCDEAGGGSADLPPESVLVIVDSAEGRALEHVPGPIEAVGMLEVGNRVDEQGRSASFRLRLERPLAAAPTSPAVPHG
ncbi:MAG: hypothetical protein JWN48_4750 [Myxococcaceae bacterium]|nr:hypothetical protein [Myxococcaceae bacterium]